MFNSTTNPKRITYKKKYIFSFPSQTSLVQGRIVIICCFINMTLVWPRWRVAGCIVVVS